ncbi:MAG: DNRLRE domain-containing protein [Candidatus Fermentibacteraceae bacterium]
MRSVTMAVVLTVLIAAVASADTIVQVPDADTWIWPGQGPFGSSQQLRTNNISSFDQRIVISFDLSSLPQEALVSTAYLNIYRYDGTTGSALDCEIYRVTEPWNETTLVNSIAYESAGSYDQIIVTENGWYEFDVKNLVQEWVQGTYPNYGAVFFGTGGAGLYQNFYSREAASQYPYLVVEYELTGSFEQSTFGAIKALYR